ncbi:MAG: TIGR03560 family F420-dependent LLM class oxidoreductase [Terriglobales bacterium]
MELTVAVEGQEGVSWQQWLTLAHACEQHGISTLYRSDHYLNLDGHLERGSLEAWGTICGLAAVTSKLRLGTLVSPATFRHPAVLAALVTAADHISGGRVELGLGAGWHQDEHIAFGFEFYDLKTRMDLLKEQLQIVLGCWGGGPYSFTGSHYELVQLDALPKPVQLPRPPIVMGGQAGPRGARLAAAYADEYNLVDELHEVRERCERLRAACEKAGRDPQTLKLSVCTTVIVGADEAAFRSRASQFAARRGQSVEELLAGAPASWILGTVDQAAEQLEVLVQAGVTKLICEYWPYDDPSYLEVLACDLASRL